jgi:tetratricopeptide (TPR) repeat protein
MRGGKFIAALFVIGIVLLITYVKSNTLNEISEWNQFSVSSRAITEIEKNISNLNSKQKNKEIRDLLIQVDDGVDLSKFNAKDQERLCRLYDKYNLDAQLRGCYRKIINSRASDDETKAWIRIVKKQLTYNDNGYGPDNLFEHSLEWLVNEFSSVDTSDNIELLTLLNNIPLSSMDIHDRYQISKTLLQYSFESEKAKAMLFDIIRSSNDINITSKSYFVLARYELEKGNLEDAFDLYSEYIDEFNDKEDLSYFVSKAQQRLLQISIELGANQDIDDAVAKLLDQAAGSSDLRIEFDVARKLSAEGLQKEATEIFKLGLQKVQTNDLDSLSLYQKVRIYAEIVRAGNVVGLDFPTHDGYVKIIDNILGNGLHEGLTSDKELNYLYSQFLLWAAEGYRLHHKFNLSEIYLARFIAIYPDSKDYEYAVYRFLISCVELQCHENRHKPILVYAPAEGGFIAEKTIGTFSSLFQDVHKKAWKGEIQKWLD